MSDDWIKYRVGLPTNPRVVRIAGLIRKPIHQVTGALMALWAIGDQHTTDGVLDGYTPEVLDEVVGIKGFSDALKTVGWLEIGEGSLTIPKFDEHNSQSAKRRALKAKNMARYRGRSVDRTGPQNDHAVTTQGPPEKEKEKEKEEEKTKGISPAAAQLPPLGAGEAPPLPAKPKPPPVNWDPLGGWRGIDERRRTAWAAAYPACNLDRQLAAMHAWLTANPERARKSNYERFITNWLKKEQDRGGDMRSNGNGRSNERDSGSGEPATRPTGHRAPRPTAAEERAKREFPEPPIDDMLAGLVYRPARGGGSPPEALRA